MSATLIHQAARELGISVTKTEQHQPGRTTVELTRKDGSAGRVVILDDLSFGAVHAILKSVGRSKDADARWRAKERDRLQAMIADLEVR